MYLVMNKKGREYDAWANHFSPYSPIYSPRERKEILISDLALGLAAAGLYCLGNTYGWLWLVKVLCPYSDSRVAVQEHLPTTQPML